MSFPVTRVSIVEGAQSPDPDRRARALNALAGAYWRPIYKYVRIKWNMSPEDAEDLTQEFFARSIEKGYFERYDSGKARFRTFVRMCVDRFVANERKAAGRQKRGGDRAHVSLDFESAEGELKQQQLTTGETPDDLFHREWVRTIFALAVSDTERHYRDSGRQQQYALFERYDLIGPPPGGRLTYEDLARETGLSVTQVTNTLASVRRRFREAVLGRIRDVSTDDTEYRTEAKEILRLSDT